VARERACVGAKSSRLLVSSVWRSLTKGGVFVRDSKQTSGPVLRFPWGFIAFVKHIDKPAREA